MRTHPISQANSNEEALERLVERTLRGDERAWQELWLALDPIVENVARRSRVAGRLSRCPDGRRDIVVRVMAALREDGFRRLAGLRERLACRDGSFRPWIWKLARDASVDHVRVQPEYMGRGARSWACSVPLPEALTDDRPAPCRQLEARRILACFEDVLDPAQRDAISRWLRGDDFAEIAATLGQGMGAGAAERLVRSGVERLRARFADRRRSPRRRARGKKIDRPA